MTSLLFLTHDDQHNTTKRLSSFLNPALMKYPESEKAVQDVDTPKFPASAPIDHPHILTVVESVPLRLCDAITTLLHRLEAKQPGVLNDFFDAEVKSFKLIRSSDASFDKILYIVRTNNIVTAGLFTHWKHHFVWQYVCKSTITNEGSWLATWGDQWVQSEAPIDGFLTAGFLGTINSNDKDKALDVSRNLADSIYQQTLWAEYFNSRFELEIVRELVQKTTFGRAEELDMRADEFTMCY